MIRLSGKNDRRTIYLVSIYIQTHTMSKTLDDKFKSTINQTVVDWLDKGDSDTYDDFKKALYVQVIDLVNQERARYDADIAKLKAQCAAAEANAPPKLKAKKKSSSGEGASGGFPQFSHKVALMKEKREKHPNLANLVVNVTENFKTSSSSAAKYYNSNKDKFSQDGVQINGQELTFAQLYDAILTAAGDDNGRLNHMTHSGFMWGLLNDSSRAAVFEA